MSEEKLPLFDESVKPGVLILVEPDETRKCKCTLWFDFTMNAIRKIGQGDLVAIQNFNTTKEKINYSIFRLTEVLPRHFALSKDDLKAYPGNLEESAKSIFPDFTEQQSESTEDLTKIFCEAFPINLQYVDEGNLTNENLTEDDSLPITGSEILLISKELTELIYNSGIDKEAETTVEIGNLIKNQDVGIFVNSEELIKVHFGLFGYTGAGKSNLLSTIIRSVLLNAKTHNKFILFDIMDEYTGLLIDQLLDEKINGMIISLGRRYLPDSVIKYLIKKDESLLDEAAKNLLRGMYLPKPLRPFKESYLPFIKKLLENNKVKVIDLTFTMSVEEFSEDFWDDVFTDYIKGTTKMDLERSLEKVFRGADARTQLDPDVAQNLIDKLNQEKKPGNAGKDKTFNDMIEHIIAKLEDIKSEKDKLPEQVTFSVDQISTEFADDTKKSLILLTSEDPNIMRKYAKKIGNPIYRARSRTATISPLVSFIFDEADEFIPQGGTGSKSDSREIIERLARRGRKFGLGVGLATQRITYLDTNIMGQLHSYFVSKLPRKSDREKIGEAFGLIEDDFKQTFRFKKGDWMLISHDATGLESEPIPIHSENAEDRIKEFLGIKKGQD